MNKLKTLLKEFKDSGWLNEGKWWIGQSRFFQNFFLKENFEVLKFEDYQKKLNYIHYSFRWYRWSEKRRSLSV